MEKGRKEGKGSDQGRERSEHQVADVSVSTLPDLYTFTAPSFFPPPNPPPSHAPTLGLHPLFLCLVISSTDSNRSLSTSLIVTPSTSVSDRYVSSIPVRIERNSL